MAPDDLDYRPTICDKCYYLSPTNQDRCSYCDRELTSEPLSYDDVANYYHELSRGYHRYSKIAIVASFSTAIPIPIIYFYTNYIALAGLFYLCSSFFLAISEIYQVKPGVDTYRGLDELIVTTIIICIPVFSIPLILSAIFRSRPQNDLTLTKSVRNLLDEMEFDENGEITSQSMSSITIALEVLASIERSQIRSVDMYIFYKFVEKHPDLIFTHVHSDQLFAVVSNLYGDLTGPERQQIVELLAESSDGQYTQTEIEMETRVTEESFVGERLSEVPKRMPDETCNARRHDDGQFLGYCDRTAGWGTDSDEGRCRTHLDSTVE